MSQPPDSPVDDHLSRISTRPTLPPHAQIERYRLAATRYVGHLVHGDREATQAVLDQLVDKFFDGLLKKWDGRGRFRDYLKVTLRNAVRDCARGKARCRERLWADLAQLPDVEYQPGGADPWVELYAADLLALVRKALAAEDDPVLNTVIEALLELGEELSSVELAKRLEACTRKPCSEENARKTKERARRRLAKALLNEVRSVIETPTDDNVVAELRELGLYRYVEKYWDETDS
jgi:hypothetical protein